MENFSKINKRGGDDYSVLESTYGEGLRLVVSVDACFGLAEKDLLEQDKTINSEIDGGVFEVHLNLI